MGQGAVPPSHAEGRAMREGFLGVSSWFSLTDQKFPNLRAGNWGPQNRKRFPWAIEFIRPIRFPHDATVASCFHPRKPWVSRGFPTCFLPPCLVTPAALQCGRDDRDMASE
jgi:hypothetical protein